MLVVNGNFDHILYRFRDIVTKTPEIAVFNYSVSSKGFAGTETRPSSVLSEIHV